MTNDFDAARDSVIGWILATRNAPAFNDRRAGIAKVVLHPDALTALGISKLPVAQQQALRGVNIRGFQTGVMAAASMAAAFPRVGQSKTSEKGYTAPFGRTLRTLDDKEQRLTPLLSALPTQQMAGAVSVLRGLTARLSAVGGDTNFYDLARILGDWDRGSYTERLRTRSRILEDYIN